MNPTKEALADVRAYQRRRRMSTRERHIDWDLALYDFREAVRVVTAMARDPDFRDMAAADLAEITDAVLAANLMWSQLKAREAA